MKTYQSSSDKYGSAVYEISADEIADHETSMAEIGLPIKLTESYEFFDGQEYATLEDEYGDIVFIEVTPFTIEARLVSDLS